VLPRGLNFGRKTQKGPKKMVWGRENLGPKFWQIYQKRAEKGRTFLWLNFSSNYLDLLTIIVLINWSTSFSPAILYRELLKKTLKFAFLCKFYDYLSGAEFFRQRPNFFVDPAENCKNNLATLIYS
jgi:hypothetical protein